MARTMRSPGLVLVTTAAALAACASPPPPAPIAAEVVRPGPGERVVVEQALVVTDASGSMTGGAEYGRARALTEAFVAGMPDGSYEAGAIAFGGPGRTRVGLSAFERAPLASWAAGIPEFGETTPLTSVIRETGAALGSGRGQAALIVFSDGLPMSNGVRDDGATALAAARAIDAERAGRLCIYTVQVGASPEGKGFLRELADATGCGLHRNESELQSARELLGFQRAIFLGSAPKAAPGDRDGDGVTDDRDRCPRTPRGAQVDDRGCWVIAGLNFDTDRAEIKPEFRPRLEQVIEVLEQNPGLRIRVDGHTDDTGSAAYNQALSERRAAAVAGYFTAQGVDAGRIESKGFGETSPAVPNDSAANRYRNRRTELSVID